MNEPRHLPFDNGIRELSPADLGELRSVHEGWYVEYKQAAISQRDLAKSLSSFANQYGGWLFIGVAENRETHVAETFPGIPTQSVATELEKVRNAAKDSVRPNVYFHTMVVHGPVNNIGLLEGNSIIVVNVPQGPDTPYIHIDGRVYRRVGDSSTPVHISDRAEFDRLSERGRIARARLEDKVNHLPEVSKGEEDTPFLHINIMSDPYETIGHRYSGSFADFAAVMAERMLPFDNVFPATDGFVARQVMNNQEPQRRLLTWEWSLSCDSFITLPINLLAADSPLTWPASYATVDSFFDQVETSRYRHQGVLDLERTLVNVMHLVVRHRRLAARAGVNGPFFVKVRLENMWRRVPFLDVPEYLEQMRQYGLPLIQQGDILAPPGKSLDTFAVWPERDAPRSGDALDVEETGAIIADMLEVGKHIFYAVGLPVEIIKNYSSTMADKYFTINTVPERTGDGSNSVA